jgi:hypothetical protein
MTYFPDLSPYAYGYNRHPGVVHVGWLDGIHPFPKGCVALDLVEKMKLLASKPVELYRGYHYCEICIDPPDLVKSFVPGVPMDPELLLARLDRRAHSNGEIRVVYGGVTFAAPVLIVHYIEEHGYLPPTDFLKAVEELG